MANAQGPVVLYRATDQNAPTLNGNAGVLVELLDRVLVNGYGNPPAAVTSITRSSTTATVTLTAANSSIKTGDYITIAGADQSAYNGTFAITVTSTTTFTYTVAGSPATPATGTITYCGYLPITSLTRSGVTATATLGISNTTLRTGDYVTISGANESDYNGSFQITYVDSTHFSYTVANSPSTPATGTLFYRKAPLGWTIPYTGTNKRAYRSNDNTSNQYYLRVDDTTTLDAYVRGYVTMSTVDDGTEPFPTATMSANGNFWEKSHQANTTAKDWCVIGDSRTFYYQFNNTTVGCLDVYGFGHFLTYKGGDSYNTFLAGGNGTAGWSTTTNSTHYTGLTAGNTYGATSASLPALAIPRGYTQLNTAIWASAFDGRNGWTSPFGYTANTGVAYPNGPDGGLWIQPLMVMDYTGGVQNLRGRFPGVYAHLHGGSPVSNQQFITGVVGLDGRTLMGVQTFVNPSNTVYYTGYLILDVSGPWS